MASTERFGYEWNKYSKLDENYESQFKNWVFPLNEYDFEKKIVLDAGCGMGRNSYWAKKWGADQLVAFDYDERSIASAKKTLGKYNGVIVEFKNIYDLDWIEKFDIVFSIGVIHHLEDPKKALSNMIKALKPGGKILIWVYGYEGNEWIVRFINPVRQKITSKLPVKIVDFLSYFLSVPLYVFVKLFHGPGPYLKQISKFKFWHVHSIVFDQLIPKVANYWRKEEAENLLKSFAELEDVKIFHKNKNSWTVLGTKKQ